jgi:hypothetical protein
VHGFPGGFREVQASELYARVVEKVVGEATGWRRSSMY